jgi:hypothetical protein
MSPCDGRRIVCLMPDGPPIPNRQRRATKLVMITTLLAGAVALCTFGIHLITENYDGFVSWFNPVAAASCCAAIIMTLIVVFIAIGRRKSAP